MAQKLAVLQSLWAMERRQPDGMEWTLSRKLELIRDAGFDGAGVRFIDPAYAREVTAFLKLIDDSNVATDIGNRTFSFNFVHNETPNADDPCANGQPNGSGVNVNGCADIITVSVSSGTESFSIGGVDYTLGVQGFLATSGPNIGTLVTGFQTVEAATNTAQIVTIADKTENVLVPEPGILALLAGGLLGLGLALRRRGPGHWGRAAFSAA